MSVLEAIVLLAIPGGLIVTATVTESRRLRDAAQRFRELEDECQDGWERLDASPEFDTACPRIRMPDGGIIDAGPSFAMRSVSSAPGPRTGTGIVIEPEHLDAWSGTRRAQLSEFTSTTSPVPP